MDCLISCAERPTHSWAFTVFTDCATKLKAAVDNKVVAINFIDFFIVEFLLLGSANQH